MRTHTTMLLLVLFAISSHGCGRTGGGASEVTAAGPSAEQRQPNIRVAEATTQGATSSQSTGVVEDGVYEVCDVEYAGEAKMGASEKKPTGPHIKLSLWDEIDIKKGGAEAPVGSRHIPALCEGSAGWRKAQATKTSGGNCTHDDQLLQR